MTAGPQTRFATAGSEWYAEEILAQACAQSNVFGLLGRAAGLNRTS